jgi:hypothetical protein
MGRRGVARGWAILLWSACAPRDPADVPSPADTDAPSADSDTTPPVEPDTDAPPPPLDTDAPTSTLTGEPATITPLPVAPCADTAPTAPLLDVHGEALDAQPFLPTSRSLFVGAGLAVADLDGDGWLDLVRTAYDSAVVYLGGGPAFAFTDRSSALPPLPERTAGVTPVDLDADGDLDLHVSVWQGPSVALLNDGAGAFTLAPPSALDGRLGAEHASASFGDLDGDGDLDAFLAAYGPLNLDSGRPQGSPSSILMQDPAGTWTDVAPQRPADDPVLTAYTFSGAFLDPDRDQRPELLLLNDFGWMVPSTLLDNVDGELVWTDPVGVESRLESMGLAIGDLNDDGVDDLLMTAWGGFRLYESLGDAWFETSAARGLLPDDARDQDVAWGAEFADLDNDGDLDAPVVFGKLAVQDESPNADAQPDALFVQGEDGRFTDVGEAWGFADTGRGRGVLAVDLDHDGWLDLITAGTQSPVRVQRGACGARTIGDTTGDEGWLELILRQPGSNPYAIGARVDLAAGDARWTRAVRAGGASYMASGPPDVHVGLGPHAALDELIITWPDGATTTVGPLAARQRLEITRVAAPGGTSP